MIRPRCNKCRDELTEFGGVAICPPETMPDGSAGKPLFDDWKIHLCVRCWCKFTDWLLF